MVPVQQHLRGALSGELDYRAYWDCAPNDAPSMSGAAMVMDCHDLKSVLAGLRVDLSDKYVFDYGCGTGRLAKLCGVYLGCDISPGMVEYARSQGRHVRLVDDSFDAADCEDKFDVVTCLSVMTHVNTATRRRLLKLFRKIAPSLVVDILPARQVDYDAGSIGTWHIHPPLFEGDLVDAGWGWDATYQQHGASGEFHRYYSCAAL